MRGRYRGPFGTIKKWYRCGSGLRRARTELPGAASRTGVLVCEEQAVPGVGEEVLIASRGPPALADQQLVGLGGVGGPDDVACRACGAAVRVWASRSPGGGLRRRR